MNVTSFFIAMSLLVAWLPCSALAATRRLAVVVGNNAGTGAQPPLRYAENDAGKMARVLVELGDVTSENLFLLQGKSISDLEVVLESVRERVAFYKQQPDLRSMLVFYFSGHSDGESLEMGKERVLFTRLKSMLSGTGADLRLSIIDACRSGAALKEKGARPAPGFTIKLSDNINASGEAFISSSAADEVALESSEVMGSFFTHNFISGLRGAADASGDHQITLSEAYQYAYERTVAATSILPVGAQHPRYDYRLSGQGEWIISSLLLTQATLVLPQDAERVLVIDTQRDQVLAEFGLSSGREVGLPAGAYGIQVFKAGKSLGARVSLKAGARRELNWSEFTPLSSNSRVAFKGLGVEKEVTSPAEPNSWLSLLGGIGVGSVASDIPYQNLVRASYDFSRGSGLGLTLQYTQGALRDWSESSLQARLGYHFALMKGPFWGALGLDVGPSLWWQLTKGESLSALWSPQSNKGSHAALVFTLAPKLSGRYRLWQSVWLTTDVEMAMHLAPLEETQGTRIATLWTPSALAGLAFAF